MVLNILPRIENSPTRIVSIIVRAGNRISAYLQSIKRIFKTIKTASTMHHSIIVKAIKKVSCVINCETLSRKLCS